MVVLHSMAVIHMDSAVTKTTAKREFYAFKAITAAEATAAKDMMKVKKLWQWSKILIKERDVCKIN